MPSVMLHAPDILEQPAMKRKVTVERNGIEWNCIHITGGESTQTPSGSCVYCGKHASWTAVRIKDHILGINGCKACPAGTEEFLETKEKILELRRHKEATKRRRSVIENANNIAETPIVLRQSTIESSMSSAKSTTVDEAVATFIYAENLSARIVASTHFASLLRLMASAPPSYRLPNRRRINGDLLNTVTSKLRALDEPIRKACLAAHGCTVMCDGWDDISRNHLVNCLYGTAGASFFEGTTQLDSETHEDAVSVANFLKEAIDKLAPPVATVVHVVTDTCSTMKGAWRIVERERPWISTTCCAPHVLSLLLKDIASIAEVSNVMDNMEQLLRRFWGRSRWPRMKLNEVTSKNHGKPLGLYRAKATRFAGKVSSHM